MILILFPIASLLAVFFFLLSLRRLGNRTTSVAILFAGIAQLILSMAVPTPFLRIVSAATSLFIIAFSITKIVRKMY